MNKKKWRRLFATLLCMLLVLTTACGGKHTPSEDPSGNNTNTENTENTENVDPENTEPDAPPEDEPGGDGADPDNTENDNTEPENEEPDVPPEDEPGEDEPERDAVETILASMSMDEKISQMIIPAIRTWEGKDVTELSAVPGLQKALRRHQYGGILLFGQNVTGTGQVTRLIADLQENNLHVKNVSAHVPYFMPVDQEGGAVVRLVSGTRMTGSMAIGATGDRAAANALATGQLIGRELAAVGWNVDFAPDVDVNSNPANPVIGTRAFSDDPAVVAELGRAFARGLRDNGVIATYKHFPGHGDTGTDSHIGTATVRKTYEELRATELAPFRAAIENGAELIMTAHITFPLIDKEVVFGDGETKGYYPATMSHRIISEILRRDMGYEGVVVTDALEMDAIRTAGLVPGEKDSTEYRVNIAQQVILAGVDILLVPADLKGEAVADFYDEYVDGLIAKVRSGAISEERIDESVERILRLKEKYGILESSAVGDVDRRAAEAETVVGCDAHRTTELEMARQAVTLVRNEGQLLPLSENERHVVILARLEEEMASMEYAVRRLREEGLLSPETQVTIDYYYDPDKRGDEKLHCTEELQEAIGAADVVIGLSKMLGLGTLAADSPQYQALQRAIEEVHAAGGKFILLSNNLPYDAARYREADAVLLAYMGAGLDADPTARDGSAAASAYNANVLAAMEIVFGGSAPVGRLPIDLPVILEKEDGTLTYGRDRLYERGFGLSAG